MLKQPTQTKRFILCKPDYSEWRQGQTLYIWKDIPHWMVVDAEMQIFLDSFRRPNTLSDVMERHVEFQSHKKALVRTIRKLLANGVLRVSDTALNRPRISSFASIENVAWNLTHQCNLCCKYCYYRKNLDGTGTPELSAEQVTAFLKTIKPYLSKKATLTILGGEPLMDSEKLIKVCQVARKLRIKPLVSTNGTLIDDAFSRQAKRVGLEVQISLDGPNAQMNDPLRGTGTFQKIKRGVSVLKTHGVHTILSMVCCRQNFSSLKAFLDLALEWQVPEARFIPLKMMGGAKIEGMEMVQHHEIVTTSYQLIKENPQYRPLLGRDCLSILANTCRYSNRRSSCGTGSQTLLLDVDGTLFPCLNLNMGAFAFGNICDKNFDFNKVWNGSRILDDVRAAVSINNSDRHCSKCAVCYWCLGGCRGETVANTGRLTDPSIHCGDLRKTIIEIMWILAENADILKGE